MELKKKPAMEYFSCPGKETRWPARRRHLPMLAPSHTKNNPIASIPGRSQRGSAVFMDERTEDRLYSRWRNNTVSPAKATKSNPHIISFSEEGFFIDHTPPRASQNDSPYLSIRAVPFQALQ